MKPFMNLFRAFSNSGESLIFGVSIGNEFVFYWSFKQEQMYNIEPWAQIRKLGFNFFGLVASLENEIGRSR